MKIFIDTANLEEIEKYLEWGICDGVTTNPSINVAIGVRSFEEMRERSIQIARLIDPRPLSVEVTSDDFSEMLSQGHEYASWAGNINVKIGDETIEGKPGSFVRIPRGTPHTFWNTGSTPAKLLAIFSPAGFEEFFVEAVGEEEVDVETFVGRAMGPADKYNMEVTGPPLG